MSELFRKLADANNRTEDSRYSFQGDDSPFRDRPGVSSTTRSTKTRQGSREGSRKRYDPSRDASRDKEGDRHHAYMPPAVREEGVVVEWEPPSFKEILKDLGLRVLEVALGAAASAAGNEVAYFFRKRRFYTDDQVRRRDW